MAEYRVQLPVFSGPLDLLLHLVRERELPIEEVRLGDLADQYLEFVKALEAVDLDQTGEFLVIASTLMEIKSRELLPDPSPEEEQELEELRTDLIERLIEYRQYREAARTLAERLADSQLRFARQAPPIEPPADAPPAAPLSGVEIWDLVKAYAKILRETGSTPLEVRYEDVPVAVHMERVVQELSVRPDGEATFRELGGSSKERLWWIGLFLSLLELTRLSKIRIRLDPEGEIKIALRQETPS